MEHRPCCEQHRRRRAGRGLQIELRRAGAPYAYKAVPEERRAASSYVFAGSKTLGRALSYALVNAVCDFFGDDRVSSVAKMV